MPVRVVSTIVQELVVCRYDGIHFLDTPGGTVSLALSVDSRHELSVVSSDSCFEGCNGER